MKSIGMPALRAVMLACALGWGPALLAGEAQAQAPYGCACLHNKSEHMVKFRYRWGDGEWKNDHLRSGYQETLCWRYAAGSTSSPNLTFQIDVDLSGGTAWTTYALPRVQASTNSCEAVAHNFHYDISYKPNTNRQYLTMTRRP
jgi:hypothetical protein